MCCASFSHSSKVTCKVLQQHKPMAVNPNRRTSHQHFDNPTRPHAAFISYAREVSRPALYINTIPAPAAAKPNISIPIAAVCLGAHAPAVEPELATVPVPVALELAAEVPVAVAAVVAALPLTLAPAEAAVEHDTTVGTETPWAEQIWVAKAMALVWSAGEQAPWRQQATLPRKFWFEQMHLGSVPQPA